MRVRIPASDAPAAAAAGPRQQPANGALPEPGRGQAPLRRPIGRPCRTVYGPAAGIDGEPVDHVLDTGQAGGGQQRPGITVVPLQLAPHAGSRPVRPRCRPAPGENLCTGRARFVAACGARAGPDVSRPRREDPEPRGSAAGDLGTGARPSGPGADNRYRLLSPRAPGQRRQRRPEPRGGAAAQAARQPHVPGSRNKSFPRGLHAGGPRGPTSHPADGRIFLQALGERRGKLGQRLELGRQGVERPAQLAGPVLIGLGQQLPDLCGNAAQRGQVGLPAPNVPLDPAEPPGRDPRGVEPRRGLPPRRFTAVARPGRSIATGNDRLGRADDPATRLPHAQGVIENGVFAARVRVERRPHSSSDRRGWQPDWARGRPAGRTARR